MIEITYHQRLHSLEMKGHARSEEEGRDLVCAAASMLAATLAQAAEDLKTAGAAVSAEIRLDKGDAGIYCKARERHDSAVRLVFDSICKGFDLLAHEHPQYVHYRML